MAMGKGKAKEDPIHDEASEPSTVPAQSFLGRLGDSATGLAKDVAAPGGSHIQSGLSSTLGAVNKAGTSTAASTLAQNGVQIPHAAPSTGSGATSSATTHGFRSGLVHKAGDGSDLDQWASGNIDTASFPRDSLSQHSTSHDVTAHVDKRLQCSIMSSTWAALGQVPMDNQLQDTRDGADVVNMLSDPSFQPQFWDESGLDPGDDSTFKITAEEKSVADLFLQHPSASTSNPLFESFERSLKLDSSAGSQDNTLSFFDDLRHYHEQVWGIVETLVLEAHKELQEGQTLEQSPAVARLKMVLGHIDPAKLR